MCLSVARGVYQGYTAYLHRLLDACLIAFNLAEWCFIWPRYFPCLMGKLCPSFIKLLLGVSIVFFRYVCDHSGGALRMP